MKIFTKKDTSKSISDGYWEAVAKSFRTVVGRFSRGNVNSQRGNYMTDDSLDKLRECANEALERILQDAKA